VPARRAAILLQSHVRWAAAIVFTLCVSGPLVPRPVSADVRIPKPPAPPQGTFDRDAKSGDLPAPARETRQRLLAMAQAGQYEALEIFALKGGVRFVFHQGFERMKPARYWRAQAARGIDPLKSLVALLQLPPAYDQGIYMWPAAAVSPSPTALADLRTLYDPARIQRYAKEGYTGWRTGIDDQGRWRLFLRSN